MACSAVFFFPIMHLTHTDDQGRASMVDVSAKPLMAREAVAEARIKLEPATLSLIQENGLKKGDVLVIIESMKMEFNVHAPCDGEVHAVLAAEGSQVGAGIDLVVLKQG